MIIAKAGREYVGLETKEYEFYYGLDYLLIKN